MANTYSLEIMKNSYNIDQKNTKIELNTNQIKTFISFNLGTTWSRIIAPRVDSLGNPTKCYKARDCYLNLYINDFTPIPPVYSAKNAPGIIIAVGNII